MGRKKNIETPERLYELFEDYVKWCKSNPRIENILVHKSAEVIPVEREQPLTWKGFEMYLFDHGIVYDLSAYEINREGNYTEYSPIIRTIKNKIYNDKFSGASVGIYQHNIIARDLGLVDKKEVKADIDAPITGMKLKRD
jgi:hypothetical protein